MAQSHLDPAWELVCLYDGMYGAGSIHAKGGCADSGISKSNLRQRFHWTVYKRRCAVSDPIALLAIIGVLTDRN
jgi:hypothetical protein